MTNLIGISGKIGSGKDTIGEIIQYLIYFEEHKNDKNFFYPIDVWLEERQEGRLKGYPLKSNNYFEIKKYAFKLKQIASLMLGIPVEDFEKQEVKDRVLGEEWIRYGYANGFIQKEGKTIMNNESCSKERYEEELKTNWQTAYKSEMTVRQFLQLLGTEAMRNVIHPNTWINALFADYRCACGDNLLEPMLHITFEHCKLPNWIITDVRFPNEAKAIKNRKGILIRVNRISSVVGKHPSETALDDYQDFDYIIDNNSTIEELIEKIKKILIKEQII